MYIVTRYTVSEILKYFLAALVALTLVVTPVMGVKEGLSQGFPAKVILCAMPFMLPEMLEITIPVSLLFAICTVFGRMTGANEVVALKSLGISPMAVVWPAIVVAAFLSLGTVCLYEVAATWGKPNAMRVGLESIEKIAYGALQKNKHFDGDQFSIGVKRIEKPAKPGDNPMLIQPYITINGPPEISIWSEAASFYTDWQRRMLIIDCYRGSVEVDGKATVRFSSHEQFPVPLPDPAPPRYHRHYVAMRDVPELVGELQTSLRQLEGLREANKALGVPESDDDIKRIENCRRDIRCLKAEPYRRWANGFTCLCFALIGAPVAMLWRHADVFTNFFVCFLPILAIYYPLLMFSEGLSTSPYGTVPPIAFWMANVSLALPAISLLRWVIRH